MRLKLLSSSFLFIFIFSFFAQSVSAKNSVDSWANNLDTKGSKSIQTSISPNNLSLQCESAILIEQSTGKVLFSKNENTKLRPASVTKLMTILLIMEALDSGTITLDTSIPCSSNASNMGGSQIWLDPRETLTVHEMLKAICVVSANDCTMAMAEFLAGSEENFVKKMNEKAIKLGMKNTTFKNCHGIDEDGHLTTSYDLAILSRELLTKHPSITKYTTIWMDTLRNGKSSLVNTNKLIRNYKGATGLKTGSTSLALYNLSASATRDNLSLIAVIMKAPTTKIRFQEAEKLLNYGFSSYESKNLGKANDIISEISVEKGTKNSLKVALKNDVNVIFQKGKGNEISQSISLPENISAPINKGDKIGNVIYKINEKEIANEPLIASCSIEKNSFLTICKNMITSWCSILRK